MTTIDTSKLDGLIERQQRRGVDIRPMLLRMLTDVYVGRADHTPEDRAQYVAFALKLIDGVDSETRRTVAALLDGHPEAPREVVDKLSRHAGAGAAMGAAADDPDRRLTGRFFAAAAAERRSILADLEATSHAVPPTAADSTATVLSLERSALAGHPGEFIRELERALSLPRETAERIVNDVGGEPMVIAARALGMPLPVLQRILMFLNPAIGHSVRRVYDLSALYEEVSPAAARRLTATWSAMRATGRAAPPEPRRDFEDGLRSVAAARPSTRRPADQPLRRGQIRN